MYQFYYGEKNNINQNEHFKKNLYDFIDIKEIRPAMWEEHCLECSAPLCFKNCVYFSSRKDGRCKRFEYGMNTFSCNRGCNNEGINLQFRKWGNMMTVIFPYTLSLNEYQDLKLKNDKLGNHFKKILDSSLPVNIKWNSIRIFEFIRRNKLRNHEYRKSNLKDFFAFHGYSYHKESFKLILEIYDDNNIPKYKNSLEINPGENVFIMDRLPIECFQKNYLVKIYPEKDLEVELDIL